MSRLLDLKKTGMPGARLGEVAYGRAALPTGADLGVGLEVFGTDRECHVWLAEGPFVEGELGGLRYRHNSDFLFGWISLSEQGCAPAPDMSPLEAVSRRAYDALFAVQEKTGFTHLLRCWNYLPGINVDGGGLERYRQFNIGRQDAFIAARQAWLDGSPSACALGSAEGELVVYFLAGRQSALSIENPRQTSAYRYPAQYGPRAPTFSRASLLRLESEEILFISGTASIVGHESLHPGDVREQTLETLRNLDAVVAEANRHAFFGRFETRKLFLKVYLRHAEDLATIRETLQATLGEGLNLSFLLADVCRAELLVEIEAFGFLDAEPAC